MNSCGNCGQVPHSLQEPATDVVFNPDGSITSTTTFTCTECRHQNVIIETEQDDDVQQGIG